jgi:hypothetical protein
MEFESFYMDHTQGEVNHEDGQAPKPSVLEVFTKFTDPIWMFVPFLQASLGWENTRIRLEESSPCLP